LSNVEPRLTIVVARFNRSRMSGQRARRRRDHASRAIAETQPELEIRPSLLESLPRGELICPREVVLRAAEEVEREYRFAWLPRTRGRQADHVDLEIGPLGDIAELVVL
jgi:hypothetical protein